MDMFPVWLSLRVALTATALTLVIGIPVALLLARRRFPGKNVLEAAVVLPLVLPPTVLGYYLLLVIGSRGPVGRALAALGLELAFTWGAAVLAACVGSIALVIKSAQAGFEGVDRQLEQAARTLGRSEWSVFWSVTLPLAWLAVLAGGALAFCRAPGGLGAGGRGAERRGRPRVLRRGRLDRPVPPGAADRLCLPGLRALPAPHGRGERGIRATRPLARRTRATQRRSHRAPGPGRPRASIPSRTFGRPATTGGARAGACDRPGAPAARRAAVGARRAAPADAAR